MRENIFYALMLQQDPGDESKSERIEKELEAAIALDPKLADAYSLLGYTQAASGRPEIGMQTMKKAIELAPRNEHYQFNLANIYMMNRKMDDAIAIFRSLSGTGNPEISARANQALAQAETFQAQFKTYQVQMESRNSESIPETRAAPDSPVSRTEVSAKMAEPRA